MTADILYGMFLSAGGGPSELVRDEPRRALAAFVAGRIDTVETAWTPSVRRTNARGEGEHHSIAHIWLRLNRGPDGVVTVETWLDERGHAFTSGAEELNRLGQVAIEVATLARILNEVL